MTAMPLPNSEQPMRRYLENPGSGPTVLRIVLGSQLRRLRKERGITPEDAGKAIRGSHAKISRLELGKVGLKERDVADLLTLYGVADETERADYLALARRSRVPGWWQGYGDVMTDWFETLIGLEEATDFIRTYEVQFVPGLLQTADYAREVILLGHPDDPERLIERRVQLRMERQKLLTGPDAPTLWAVVDEAALRRVPGSVAVMREQLSRLLEVAELPNVILQVAPFASGGLAAAGGPITILRFQEPHLPDVVYLEQLTSALYLDNPDEVDDYMAVMDRLCATAEPPDRTVPFLRELLAGLD
ncbi:helix-turn-helix domain-containing protein [Streptomyces sp. PTM05]|uniref:Helix-turn-helix domain-containing protein n=1 Tax=Streptantibioticus parmotrematis TaxID=2873249 RepID=A0ABS7QY33_9ACTN|nr:helix-turn-helix transcriptional regulator [Streptantibioticus parmotrematis]MBY8887611.1 helix-turn-helix domain-containing protein [Streptantibioticus parmotrematis]